MSFHEDFKKEHPDVEPFSVDHYYDLYQRMGDIAFDLPLAPDEKAEIPDSHYWLVAAATHASTALMDILAGLLDIANDEDLTAHANDDIIELERED